jgi:hypothetical protein
MHLRALKLSHLKQIQSKSKLLPHSFTYTPLPSLTGPPRRLPEYIYSPTVRSQPAYGAR